MAVDKFIPKVWSAKILQHMRNNLVYAGLVNRDYEGEIKSFGDSVKIFSTGDVTIKDMKPRLTTGGSGSSTIRAIDGPEAMSVEERILIVDQEKYFHFGVDDVDKVQMLKDLMTEYTNSASYGLQVAIDKYLADKMVKEATVKIGTQEQPITVNEENLYSQIVRAKIALDRANVPNEGRFIVLSPEFEGLLLNDRRFIYAGTENSENALRNGKVFKAAGFDIAISNNVPVEGQVSKIVASYKGSTTFAQQLLETEAYRVHNGFGDAIKGLCVYGAKVVRPDKIVVMYAKIENPSLSSYAVEEKAGSSTKSKK